MCFCVKHVLKFSWIFRNLSSNDDTSNATVSGLRNSLLTHDQSVEVGKVPSPRGAGSRFVSISPSFLSSLCFFKDWCSFYTLQSHILGSIILICFKMVFSFLYWSNDYDVLTLISSFKKGYSATQNLFQKIMLTWRMVKVRKSMSKNQTFSNH